MASRLVACVRSYIRTLSNQRSVACKTMHQYLPATTEPGSVAVSTTAKLKFQILIQEIHSL